MCVVLDLRERDQVRARRLRLEANLEDKRGVLEQAEMSRTFRKVRFSRLCAWELGGGPTSGGDVG